jgi:hypothetical protein
MAENTGKTDRTTKRPAKSLRTHVRRLKQAASKDVTVKKTVRVRPAPAK